MPKGLKYKHCSGTRRGNTSRLVRVAAVAVAAASVVTACGNSSGETASSMQAERLLTMPAARGDIPTFTWNLPTGEPATLYPPHTYDYSPNTVNSSMCEGLMRFKPDLTMEPALAESYTNPDPLTYVFKIREGVKFWDGAPLTAEDVAYSLGQNIDPNVASYYELAYQDVKSITATGPLEVTIKMKVPSTIFLQYLAGNGAVVSEASFAREKGTAYGTASGGLMCTGPFKFTKWIPGKEIDMERNPDYWDPEYRAHSGSVRFTFITNGNTLSRALSQGEVDGSFMIPAATAPSLREASNGKFFSSTASLSFVQLVPAGKTGPMADVRLRRALSMAIDRDALVKAVLPGLATPMKWMLPDAAMTPPVVSDDVARIYQDGLDQVQSGSLDEAKKLVQQAGVPNRPLVLAIGEDSDTDRRVATIIQAAARSIGVDLEIRTATQAAMNTMFYDEKSRAGIDLLWDLDGFTNTSPLGLLPAFVGPTATVNMLGFSDPDVDANLAKAVGTTDPAELARSVTPIFTKMADEAVTIPLFMLNSNTFVNNRLAGAALSSPYFNGAPWAAAIGSAK
ncbi:hypothetical protein GTV32_17505 [Gordonia sp. SID5947]|uniref:ABC transporter substrate-binding protein n=1 Tax=Gordonia sp. SID5947 TaxID=2690315 RepID=UPI00136FC575|nr:ABC transporter substrate-binding protein [Gordonia sp. SID5947]MYR07983.1 hypothetical protein [Gordonia sp. SID5947]